MNEAALSFIIRRMNSFGSLSFFLSASITLHALLGMSLIGAMPVSENSNSIQIEAIQYEKAAVAAAPEKKEIVPAQKATVKKHRGIPVPKQTVKPINDPPKEQASDFQKFLERKIQNQERELAKLSAEQDEASREKISRPAAKKSRTRSSAEILADPKKGKVFIPYFSEVKTKIQKTLFDRYAHNGLGKGSVTLTFILNPRGFLDKVVVASRQGNVDEKLEQVAMQCLRDAAPFDRFPPELGIQRIAFNVTIFFEGKE